MVINAVGTLPQPAAPRTLRWAALRRFGLPLLLASCAGQQRPPPEPLPKGELEHFHGSRAAETLGTEGWIVVEELRRDLGAGDEEEALVVEGRLLQGPEPEELRLSTWRPTPEGWRLLARSEAVPGSSVGLLTIASCDEEPVLLFAAVEEEPDQRRHRLYVFEELPELEKSLGVQRDVAAEGATGFEATKEGFGFRTAEGLERWRCDDGDWVGPTP
ncbi:hypothetical protein [Vulgatibacter sp.]|uniref:hypothetical protein n=1 Tax=Vulgatibacter sp. TaxID=1971226 RepID=UPI003567B2A0